MLFTQGLFQERLIAAARAGKYQAMALELLPGDASVLRQGVIAATHQHKTVLQQRRTVQVRIQQSRHVDAEFRLTAQYGLRDRRGGVIEQPNSVVREPG